MCEGMHATLLYTLLDVFMSHMLSVAYSHTV